MFEVEIKVKIGNISYNYSQLTLWLFLDRKNLQNSIRNRLGGMRKTTVTGLFVNFYFYEKI